MMQRGGFMGRVQGGTDEAYRLSSLDSESLRLLWRYLRPHRWRMLAALTGTLAVAGTTLLMPYLSKVAIDRHITQGNAAGLVVVSLVYIALNGLFWLGSYAQGYLAAQVGQRVVFDLRRELLHHVLRQSISFHEEQRVGQIASRLTNDVNALSEVVSTSVLSVLSDAVSLVGMAAIMAVLSPALTLVTLLAVPVLVLGMRYLGGQMRAAYRDVQQQLARVNTGVEQGVTGMRVVQSLSRESFSIEQFQTLSLQHMRANLRVSLLFAAIFPMMTIINTLGTALVLGYGGALTARGAITLGTLVAFLSYVTRFFTPLRELSVVYNTLQAGAAALDRIREYMRCDPGVAAPEHPEKPADGFRGEVAFHNVCFAYDGEDVLSDVDLHMAPGETVALVGATGAGKTTLTRLLARLYDPRVGSVTLDGVDLRQVANADLRRAVAVVPQETYLFSDTLRENIRFGAPQANDEQIEEAARRAQAHVFIERLPAGYDTAAGEAGALLSGGQKQLVAFARALLADPRVLILDEATSNVDAHTEALIQEAMAEIRRGRTTVIVAHRFATVRQADRIVVLEGGRVVGQGTHEDLLRECEAYRRLYEKQWATAP